MTVKQEPRLRLRKNGTPAKGVVHVQFYGDDHDAELVSSEWLPKDARPAARLFLATPRLLAAAKAALKLMEDELEDNEDAECEWEQTVELREAIQRAEGSAVQHKSASPEGVQE